MYKFVNRFVHPDNTKPIKIFRIHHCWPVNIFTLIFRCFVFFFFLPVSTLRDESVARDASAITYIHTTKYSHSLCLSHMLKLLEKLTMIFAIVFRLLFLTRNSWLPWKYTGLARIHRRIVRCIFLLSIEQCNLYSFGKNAHSWLIGFTISMSSHFWSSILNRAQ